jgi:hypothetical protein
MLTLLWLFSINPESTATLHHQFLEETDLTEQAHTTTPAHLLEMLTGTLVGRILLLGQDS